MSRTTRLSQLLLVTVGAVAIALGIDSQAEEHPGGGPIRSAEYLEPGTELTWESLMEFEDSAGGTVAIRTLGEPFSTKGHPFFEARGSNGRGCVTCHQPANAMSISVDMIRRRWDETGGKDPLFAAIDGSNCPNLPPGERSSHSLLLDKGLFRVALPWPPRAANGSIVTPEFEIEVIRDPTTCNLSQEYGLRAAQPMVSVYRRPRMAANLRYLATPKYPWRNSKEMMPLERDPETGAQSSMSIMADARVTSLAHQTRSAAQDHLQIVRPWSPQVIRQIVDLEMRLHAAAESSARAGRLAEPGGPRALGVEAVAHGQSHINGNDRDTGVFFFFDQWKTGGSHPGPTAASAEFRASVARGYDLYMFKPFWISETYGLNTLRLGNPYKNTCSFCHTVQLMGFDAVPGWMDLGTTNFPHAIEEPGLPMFKISCRQSALPHPYLGRTIYTQDPGRALISGKCQDVGSIAMQQFRGLAARAPYFVNGSAATIAEIIDYYDRRYNIRYTDQEKQDLANFLSVL